MVSSQTPIQSLEVTVTRYWTNKWCIWCHRWGGPWRTINITRLRWQRFVGLLIGLTLVLSFKSHYPVTVHCQHLNRANLPVNTLQHFWNRSPTQQAISSALTLHLCCPLVPFSSLDIWRQPRTPVFSLPMLPALELPTTPPIPSAPLLPPASSSHQSKPFPSPPQLFLFSCMCVPLCLCVCGGGGYTCMCTLGWCLPG